MQTISSGLRQVPTEYPEDFPTDETIRDGTAVRPYRTTICNGFLTTRHKWLASAPLQENSVSFKYPVFGKLRREDALKLYEMAYFSDGDILELGTYKGLSSTIMGEALKDAAKPYKVYTADLNPAFVQSAIAGHKRQKLDNVVTHVMEGGQFIRQCSDSGMQFGFAFIDHWHGYEATATACEFLPTVLLPGGWVLFHDFTHIGNVSDDPGYDVIRAVKDTLPSSFKFYGIFGACALYRNESNSLSTIGSSNIIGDQRAAQRWESISKWVPAAAVGAELGVFKGQLSSYFLERTPRKLYLVDPWYRQGPTWTWCKDGDPSTYNAFMTILKKFEQEINAGQVVPIVDFSVPFLRGLEPHSLDFCYLDSSHSYEGTREELPAIADALKPSDILLGDDWREDPNHRHHGVFRAVQEWVNAGSASILFVDKQQWGLRFSN